MADALANAENWRSRAEQLRRDAARARDPLTRTSLFAMSGAAEHHARHLEELAIKFRRLPRDSQRPVMAEAEAAD